MLRLDEQVEIRTGRNAEKQNSRSGFDEGEDAEELESVKVERLLSD